jgi:hypothetical protein
MGFSPCAFLTAQSGCRKTHEAMFLDGCPMFASGNVGQKRCFSYAFTPFAAMLGKAKALTFSRRCETQSSGTLASSIESIPAVASENGKRLIPSLLVPPGHSKHLSRYS